MIQPATLPANLPATGTLLMAIDTQVASGEMPAFDTQFSALLAANFMAPASKAPVNAETAPDLPLPFKTQLRPLSDKVGGKPGGKAGGKMPGKILPDSPVLAAIASLFKQSRGAGETTSDAKAQLADPATTDTGTAVDANADEATPAASEDIIQLPIPAFAIPVSAPVTVNPAPIPAPVASANAPALPLPVAKPVQPQAIASGRIQPASADAQDPLHARSAAAQAQANLANPAALEGIAFLEPAAPAPAGPAKTYPAVSEGHAPDMPQAQPEAQPVVIQAGLTTRVVLVPRSQLELVELGKLQTMAIEQAKIGEAGQQIARVQLRQAPEDPAARTVTGLPQVSLANAAAVSEVSAQPETPRARSIANGDAERAQERPRSSLTGLETAPLFPASSAAALDATAPVATSPAPAPTPSRTPDFAALIDRLVEARAAAQATREPHTVDAAIQHADFGQVSLQFRQDAAGLSVVMASADPDLAKALQAAAPAGGSFAGQFSSSGDGNAPQWRQDTSGQSAGSPSAGSPSSNSLASNNPLSSSTGQSPQHRGQSSQRTHDQAFGAANPSPRTRNQADQTPRSGIFA